MPQVSDFTVGWICALYKEYIAARYALDKIYEDEGGMLKATGDNNKYIRGLVGCHHVVVTCLPAGSIGLVSASTVVTSMRSTFPSIRFAFMVGIAGGSPRPSIDVRLGDVIIGTKVIPYRSGKETPRGFEHTVDGVRPPHILLSYVHDMKWRADVELDLEEAVERIRRGLPKQIQRDFRRPDNSLDRLYQPRYLHNDSCDCGNSQPRLTASLVLRQPREPGSRIVVHLGSIASGDAVIKDAKTRDTWAKKLDTLCFEMESAGFENIDFIAIRGICDYADSHKNDQWHGYAAMSAAVCAAEFLKTIPARDVSGSQMTITGEEIERFVAPAINELKEAIHSCVTLANHEQAISKIEQTLKEIDQRYLVLNQFETSIQHNEAAIKSRLANLESVHGNLEGALKELAESILQQKNESMSQETKQAWGNLHETVTDRSEKFRQGATFLSQTLELTAETLGDINSITNNPRVGLAGRFTKRVGEVFQGLGNNNEKEQESGEHKTENSKRRLFPELSNKAEKFTSGFPRPPRFPKPWESWERNSERLGSQPGDLREESQSIAITESLIDFNDQVETHNSNGLRSTMPGPLTSSQGSLPVNPTRPWSPASSPRFPTEPPRTVSHVRNTPRSYSTSMRDLEEKHPISPVSTGESSHGTTENRASRRSGNISRLVQKFEQDGSLSDITRGRHSKFSNNL